MIMYTCAQSLVTAQALSNVLKIKSQKKEAEVDLIGLHVFLN